MKTKFEIMEKIQSIEFSLKRLEAIEENKQVRNQLELEKYALNWVLE